MDIISALVIGSGSNDVLLNFKPMKQREVSPSFLSRSFSCLPFCVIYALRGEGNQLYTPKNGLNVVAQCVPLVRISIQLVSESTCYSPVVLGPEMVSSVMV